MPAKTRRRRKRSPNSGFVAIPVNSNITLSTLANNTVLKANLIGTLQEDLFFVSADLEWTIRGHTAGETPLEFGIAHGDLSDTEILENLDVSLVDPSDIIDKERARRPVRRMGTFSGVAAEPVFNDGRPARVKGKFIINDGKTLAAWAANRSGSTLTTGAIVQIFGKVYGRWLY